MKWSELLLILAALQASLSQNIEVSQIPEVNVIEGSTANLECSYNMSNLDLPTGWYKWYRHVEHGVDIFESDDFKHRITKVSTEDFINKRSASIQLHGVKGTDTGIYICEVEFSGQVQIKGQGKETFLNVTVSQNSSTVFIVVGVLAMISAVLVGAYLGYRCVTKHGSSARDMGPVVYTDFTTQVITALRSGGMPNQSSQQGSQNAGDTLNNMINDQYNYSVPQCKKKSQISKEYLENSLYSEIQYMANYYPDIKTLE